MEQTVKTRNENMDLLRLVSMFFVVCLHYVGWGGVANAFGVIPLNYAAVGGISVAFLKVFRKGLKKRTSLE